MLNITNNRLNATINADDLTEIKKSLNGIKGKLPFLAGLTLTERKKLNSLQAANKRFVENTVIAAINNPELLPSYINITGMASDLQLFNQLGELEELIIQLQEMIDDTKRLAGAEAYASALSCYGHFENAAAAGIQGADSIYDTLKERFSKNSRR